MEPNNFQLEAVKDRFPVFKQDIVSLYYHDPEFRAICEDYYTCIQYLNKYKRDFSEKLDSIEEYRKTLGDLEKELEDRLNKGK